VENLNLVVLIITVVGGIGLIQVIAWAVLMMRDPSVDFLKLEHPESSTGSRSEQ
jgi:hypothetical protein